MSDSTHRPEIVTFCERLAELDAADRARLKRSAGRSLAESGDALGLFYRILPAGLSGASEEIFFMLATLYPLAEPGEGGNLGATLRRARSESNGAGLDRRVQILLDADAAQLGFRLRQAIRYAQSQRVAVAWPTLLRDLLYWDHPDRFVQRAWAQSYFGLQPRAES